MWNNKTVASFVRQVAKDYGQPEEDVMRIVVDEIKQTNRDNPSNYHGTKNKRKRENFLINETLDNFRCWMNSSDKWEFKPRMLVMYRTACIYFHTIQKIKKE